MMLLSRTGGLTTLKGSMAWCLIVLEFVLFMSRRGGCSFVGDAKQAVSNWLRICLLGLGLKQLYA